MCFLFKILWETPGLVVGLLTGPLNLSLATANIQLLWGTLQCTISLKISWHNYDILSIYKNQKVISKIPIYSAVHYQIRVKRKMILSVTFMRLLLLIILFGIKIDVTSFLGDTLWHTWLCFRALYCHVDYWLGLTFVPLSMTSQLSSSGHEDVWILENKIWTKMKKIYLLQFRE